MTSVPTPQCVQCRHFNGAKWNCTAFPTRIPEPIILGEHDHRDPFPGDHGIRFEPIEEDSA